MNRNLSANSLKLIAIVAMSIDHIAWAFIPFSSVLGQIMHFFGRITFPIMCFFISEGFYHTRSVRKYLMRLVILAVVAHFALAYFEYGKFPFIISNNKIFYVGKMATSVIYPLSLGLISLIIWNNNKINKSIKVVIILLICILAMPGDYACLPVILVFFFGLYRGDIKKQMLNYLAINMFILIGNIRIIIMEHNTFWWIYLCRFGVLLVIPLFFKYNGKLGREKSLKWLFYVFYPVHLIIIGIFRWEILR